MLNGTPIPHGSIIDFTKQPVATHPTDRLALWLWCRDVPAKSSQTRKEVIDGVEGVLALGESGPSIQPLQNVIGSGRYVSLETLTTDSPVVWVSDMTIVLAKVRGLETASMKQVGTLVGTRSHNGVRKRGLSRFLSGSCNISTLKCAELQERATGTEVTCFEMMVSPSMKMKEYRLTMIFKGNEFLGSPSSRCGCPDGNLFCSHMVAFWIVIYLFQQFKGLSFDEFVTHFPPPIQSLHSIPIPWSYIYCTGTNGECQLSAAAEDLFKDNNGDGAHDQHCDAGPYSDDDDDDDEGIDILARAAEYMDASLKDKNLQRERPVKRERIVEYTKAVRQKRSGELSFTEQRKKDLLHERLHSAYEAGEIEKTTLAYYLLVNAAKRQARLSMPPPVDPTHDTGISD